MPKDQIDLMNLWTDLNIPFKEKKQLFGSPLTIIGIDVDPNKMTFSLPDYARQDLLEHLDQFCMTSPSSKGAKFTLREWQRLAGWLNWRASTSFHFSNQRLTIFTQRYQEKILQIPISGSITRLGKIYNGLPPIHQQIMAMLQSLCSVP